MKKVKKKKTKKPVKVSSHSKKKKKKMKKKKAVAKGTIKHSGQFKKGEDSRRAGGRPKGSTNRFSIADLRRAMEKIGEKKGVSFMEKWLECAWGNASDMSTVMNYMLPKLKSIEGVIATLESSMSEDLAKSIQKKLKKRFE